MMEAFHFLRPWWLAALLPLLTLLLIVFRNRRGHSPWEAVIEPHLLRHLLVTTGKRRSLLPVLLLGIGWLLAVIALAGPVWEKTPSMHYRANVPPLVLVMNLSDSMLADDLYPSRLRMAQVKLRTLLDQLSVRPVALVVYTSMAHRVMPLTEDRQLIAGMLELMTPDLMPTQGSRASAGLRYAAEMLQHAGAKQADLLLIADSVDAAAEQTARTLGASGYTVSVLAVGTPTGVATGRGKSLGIDLAAMRRVAEAGHGRFQPLMSAQGDMTMLLNGFGEADELVAGDSGVQEGAWKESGPWLILLLLPAALLLFRSGPLLVVFLAMGLGGLATPAEALEWQALWLNADQRGLQAIEAGEYRRAEALARDPLLRGIAQYRLRKYDAALASFSSVATAEGHFNRANTLVMLGRLREARQAYEQAIALKAGYPDAHFNLSLIGRMLETAKPAEPPRSPDPATAPEPAPGEKDNEAEKKATRYAEDLLDEMDRDALSRRQGQAPEGLADIGTAGGGAMLLQGDEHAQLDEGESLGQGLEAARQGGDESQRMARQGGGMTDSGGRVDQQTEASELTAQKPGAEPADSADEASDKLESEGVAGRQAAGDSETDRIAVGGKSPAERDSAEVTEDSARRGTVSEEADGTGIDAEQQQAMLHWLDGIQDDPAELLRRIFRREYQRERQQPGAVDRW